MNISTDKIMLYRLAVLKCRSYMVLVMTRGRQPDGMFSGLNQLLGNGW